MQQQVKIGIWQISEGPAAAPVNETNVHTSYSRLAQTPPGAGKPPGTPGSAPGSIKR